jgi:hypothetical protein
MNHTEPTSAHVSAVTYARRVETWRDALRTQFGDSAVLRHVVHVREDYGGRVLWEGDVGMFDVDTKHGRSVAYVLTWEDPDSSTVRVYPLLHAGIVDSPRAAARAVIVHEFERRRR